MIETELVLPKPPLQEYVLAPVAVTLIDVVEHVNSVVPVLLVIPTIGAVVFCVTVITDCELQPLAAVAVNV